MRDKKERIPVDPWLAAALSVFCPGLGELVAGDVPRGLSAFLLFVLIFGSGLYLVLHPDTPAVTGIILLAGSGVLYLLAIADAFIAARKIRNSRPVPPGGHESSFFDGFLTLIFPGAGHLLRRRWLAGSLFMAGTLFFGSLNLAAPETAFMGGGILSGLALYHAYRGGRDPRTPHRDLVLFLCLLTLGTRLAVIPMIYALRQSVVDYAVVVSESMHPTIQVGDRVLVYRLPEEMPPRGSVVMFRGAEAPFPTQPMWIKRVAAHGGERIVFRRDGMFVEGVRWVPAVPSRIRPDRLLLGNRPPGFVAMFGFPYLVPKGMIFVLGDNPERGKSYDSRVFGGVPLEYMRGEVYKVIWPPDHARKVERIPQGGLNSPQRGH